MKEDQSAPGTTDAKTEGKEEERKYTFEELGFNYNLLDGLDSMGFTHATPIQAKAIPHILDGRDVMGIAQTGTGKTAAFLLPVLNLIMEYEYDGSSSCLIISPTRELAKQIDVQAEALGYYTEVSSVAVYGGGERGNWDVQKRAMASGADIVVATPGRLLSHLNMGYVDFSKIKYFILDEADKMLDMGFHQDIIKISKCLPAARQTLMFSATMPQNIRKLAKALLNDPVNVSIAISKPAEKVEQIAYSVHDHQKINLISHLMKQGDYGKTIIFSSSKKAVGSIVLALKKAGLKAMGVSSDLDQAAREQALKQFTNGSISIVVATDVLSRGIDIKDINLVVNYDVPPDPEDYIHRIGRTARADAKGTGITLITPKDQRRFSKIERLLEREIEKTPLPEGMGEAPKYDPKANRNFGQGGKGGNRHKGRKKGRGGNNKNRNNRNSGGGRNRTPGKKS